jgi:hypothetical protein
MEERGVRCSSQRLANHYQRQRCDNNALHIVDLSFYGNLLILHTIARGHDNECLGILRTTLAPHATYSAYLSSHLTL